MLISLRIAMLAIASLLPITLTHSAETLHLGGTLSLTGKYAEMGIMNEKAFRLWQHDVNERGGLLGRPVEITILDDESDPERASALYEKLIVNDKVDLVLGPYSSAITQAVSDVTERHQYPLLVSGGSANSLWEEGKDYLFGVYVTSSRYTIGFLELLVKEQINDLAIVAADDVFSQSIALGTTKWAERYSLEVLYSGTFEKGSEGIEEQIIQARSSGARVLIVAGHYDDAVNGRRTLNKIGWTPSAYYATVGPALERYSEVLGNDAENSFSSSQWEPHLPFPGSREFSESFRQAYDIEPSYHAACAYAAGQILEAAVNKAQSLSRSDLRDALSALDAITILGRYGVDRSGRQVRHFTTTIQWQNGRKEIVAPQELTSGQPVWR